MQKHLSSWFENFLFLRITGIQMPFSFRLRQYRCTKHYCLSHQVAPDELYPHNAVHDAFADVSFFWTDHIARLEQKSQYEFTIS